MKVMIDVARSITRNDASAGSPLTRASWNGFVASLHGEPVPYMALNLVSFFSTPILVYAGIDSQGWMPTYVYPISPSMTLANLETLMTTIAGKYDGLVASNQLQSLTRPFQADDVQYRAPATLLSEIGQLMSYYYSARDDANESYLDLAAAMMLKTDQRVGFGRIFDYFRVYGLNGTTVFYANTAGNAGKVNLEYASVGDTGFTEVPDYAANAASNNKHAAQIFNHQSLLTGGLGINHNTYPHAIYKADAVASEAASDRVVVSALCRDMKTELFGPGLISGGFVNRTRAAIRRAQSRERATVDRNVDQFLGSGGSIYDQGTGGGGTKDYD
jgi:hypothetical protein